MSKRKMLSICQICLRTDRELQTVDESIHNWFDELCDFGIEEYALYCSECAYLLRKFYKFKEKCVQANNILKNWKKRKVKNTFTLLKNELPPPSLSLCKKNNHKIYICQAHVGTELDNFYDLKRTEPINRDSGFMIDTFTPNDLQDDKGSKIYALEIKVDPILNIKNANGEENSNDNVLIEEREVKIEELEPEGTNRDGLQIVAEEFKIKIDIDDNDADDNDTDDDEFDLEQLLEQELSSDDSSDNEVLQTKRRKTIAKKDIKPLSDTEDTDTKIRGRKKKKKRGLEQLKNSLINIFENTEVKDEDGKVIDKDCIIDNLEKMHNYTYNKIRRFCSDRNSLTAEAIKVLSMVQKRYGSQYSGVFATEHLTTNEEILKEFLKRQDHETYINTEHKCTLCYRGFKFKKLLDYHIAEYHNSEREFDCEICAMRFKSAQGRRKHIASHRVVFKCKLCPLVTNYRTVMENHFNYHNGVKYSCKLCSGVFKSRPCLAAHMNSMHQSQFICYYCARSFHSETGLTQHRMRKHAKEEPIEDQPISKCDLCNITFVTEDVHRRHFVKCHALKTDRLRGYKSRKRTPQIGIRKKPKYVCRVCSAVEHSIGRLTWHFKSEHPNENCESVCATGHKYLCHECGKGYMNITDFEEHKHVHTGAKPYTCEQCNKSFHRRTNLRSHLERHEPPKRVCPHCGKKFISPSNLSNHIKMHIGIRRHVCELCSKSFLHKSSLNAHVRGVHLHIRRARKRSKEPELNA